MEGDTLLYDKKHDFVFEYAKCLLEFVPKNKEQIILDLGCGTGILTAELINFGSKVMGIDSSQDMIDSLKNGGIGDDYVGSREDIIKYFISYYKDFQADDEW